MKIHLLLSCLILNAEIIFAQSQRLVFVEEFTNAGCPPCADYNPAFNELLNANPTKVVALKYQTNGPGYDVMNSHNPTQVATRDNYYNITAVPTAIEDGNVWKGSPASYTQSMLNSRAAVSSPFTISVSHYLSPAHNYIYAHADITCTQAVSGSSLVGHVAIMERNVYFTNPPGSNGEKYFEGVMVRMLPTDQGTALNSSWSPGNTKTIDLSWQLANIYDTNQLAVVVWIQNNSTKQVLQAGYSRPNIPRDAGITKVTGVNGVSCSPDVNATVTLHNYTKFPLTSAIITYSIDGGTPQQYPWSGNLASDAEVQISLPVFSLTAGKHTIIFSSSLPNGAADLDTHNDAMTKTINILLTPVAAPLTQAFTGALFPPSGWTVEDVNSDGYKWTRSSIGYNSAGSALIYCFEAPAGSVDNLYTPVINFSNAVNGASLEFDMAHAQCSSSQQERLKVDVSTNCGSTWNNIYNKIDPSLATVPGYVCGTSAFVPTSSQWRHETVSLNLYTGQPDFMVRFQSTSAYGNNIYLDNINVKDGTTGVTNIISEDEISLYPNPSAGAVFLNINLDKSSDVSVTITDPLGNIVQSLNLQNARGVYPINFKNAAQGVYFVNIKTGRAFATKKVIITG